VGPPASGSKSVLTPIERPDSISAEVARRLLVYLFSGEIESGQRIPSERKLAELLGVGRSVIRESLKPLQMLGLVDVRIGDGTYLQDADSALLPQVFEWGLLIKSHRLLELIETRRIIEVALAGLAAERRTDESLLELQGYIDQMAATIDDVGYFADADAAFHLAIGRAAGNSVLSSMLVNLRALLREWIRRVVDSPGESRQALAEHEAIMVGIAAGDGPAAEAAMRAHLARVTARLRETLPQSTLNAVTPTAQPVA
jgi:GntR family transcriptional regulator, transcriptional repressor for pyruvate dehydrogenase complex